MRLEKIGLIIVTLVLILGVGLVITQKLENTTAVDTTTSETILADNGTSTTLNEVPTSLSATAINNSWLSFDGVNDIIIIPYNITISIWFKNSTSSVWTHLVNSSTQQFVNGEVGNPNQYPFYYNTTDYIIGKSNPTTFFNGSIDEIRVYSRELNEGEPMGLYLIGR